MFLDKGFLQGLFFFFLFFFSFKNNRVFWKNLPCVARKVEWALSWIHSSLKKRGLMSKVGDYQKASVMSSLQDVGKNFVFKLDEDFKL
uniref:Uncharacterized protein n=1 Tax=Cajanus cajan TaxID=3821 RepID=A0A151RPE2_CAJCA|nr:hypothetical protein KK1_034089 [Cajanus cajan]